MLPLLDYWRTSSRSSPATEDNWIEVKLSKRLRPPQRLASGIILARTDQFSWIERKNGRPWLIMLEEPEAFVRAVSGQFMRCFNPVRTYPIMKTFIILISTITLAAAQWPPPKAPAVSEADGYVEIPNAALAPTKPATIARFLMLPDRLSGRPSYCRR
jgi:hypothetical protein